MIAMAAPVLISPLSRPEKFEKLKSKNSLLWLWTVGSGESGIGDRSPGRTIESFHNSQPGVGKWVFAGTGKGNWTNSCQIVRIALAKVNRDECSPLTHIHIHGQALATVPFSPEVAVPTPRPPLSPRVSWNRERWRRCTTMPAVPCTTTSRGPIPHSPCGSRPSWEWSSWCTRSPASPSRRSSSERPSATLPSCGSSPTCTVSARSSGSGLYIA